MTAHTATPPDANFLEQAVRKIARRPAKSRKLALKRVSQARAKNPEACETDAKVAAAKAIVRGHAARSGMAGGATGMLGAVPGVGMAAALTVGATSDLVLFTKTNVDMCSALVYVFQPDMPDEEALRLAMLLAARGLLEKRDARRLERLGAKLASDAGVKLLRKQLHRGGGQIAIEQAFKRVGIVFTRKAVEKAIPFGVGAVIGGSFNAGMTTFVGRQARKWLELDSQTPQQEEPS